VALLTLKGRNEQKVQLAADHVRKELERLTAGSLAREPVPKPVEADATLFDAVPVTPAVAAEASVALPFNDLVIAGPAPAPLLRAETFYRYQIMLRTRAMTRLSRALARITSGLGLPDDVALTTDIDPVSLS
jgi:hypothetical protein